MLIWVYHKKIIPFVRYRADFLKNTQKMVEFDLRILLFGAIFNTLTGNVVSEKIIDLTWEFDNETIYWIGVQKFNYTKMIAGNEKGYWYAGNEFEAAEHGGTHLDAPYHFNKNGWKVADIPIDRLFPNAVLVNFSQEVAAFGSDYIPNTTILQEKLKRLEPIPDNTVLLIKFGWSKYWPNVKDYMGLDEYGKLHFPGLDISTATFISNYGKFVGVGIDTASGDAGINEDFDAHRILLGNNLFILENTKIIEDLPSRNFRLVVAPMKLRDGTGGPVRIFALLNE